MTQHPDNPVEPEIRDGDEDESSSEPTEEQLLGKVIRVVEDGSSWGTRAFSETNIITTLCANATYDTDRVKKAIQVAEERGLITEMDGRYIPSGDYERYLKPGTIGSEVKP